MVADWLENSANVMQTGFQPPLRWSLCVLPAQLISAIDILSYGCVYQIELHCIKYNWVALYQMQLHCTTTEVQRI